MTVFVAASLAVIATSAFGVAAGGLISNYMNPKYLSYVAGVGFILVGAWSFWRA